MSGSDSVIFMLIVVSVLNTMVTLPTVLKMLHKTFNEDNPTPPDLSNVETVFLESEIARRYGREVR